VDGRIVAMAPERGAHLRIKGAVYRALDRAITEAVLPCQALPDGATVETGESDYEPDALVNCGSPWRTTPSPPQTLELLSPGIASTDTCGKLAAYFNVPSIAHYLIFHPTRRVVTHHHRSATGIETSIIFEGPITLAPPGLTITLEEILQRALTAPNCHSIVARMQPAWPVALINAAKPERRLPVVSALCS
jgi:Uma2 family endonuclease